VQQRRGGGGHARGGGWKRGAWWGIKVEKMRGRVASCPPQLGGGEAKCVDKKCVDVDYCRQPTFLVIHP
jgi:hypothetical protein